MAWVLLKNEYEGNDRTKRMQVLNLKREFEMQKMKETESLKDYTERLKKVVNKIRLLREELPNDRVVEKILTFFIHLKLKNNEGPTGMKVTLREHSKQMRLKVCRDAKFDETARWNWDKNEPENIKEESGEFLDDERIDDIPVRGTRSLTEIYESWSSTKQDVVAQSTAEAEYVAAALVVNQALWLRKLMDDLKMTQEEATTIFVDNQAAIAISRNPVFYSKTKYFKVKLYFVREVQKTNEVNLVHCSTGVQLADILTKGLPRSRFEVLREKIGVCSKNSKEE
nr:Copia protein [Ipomoea batatas]